MNYLQKLTKRKYMKYILYTIYFIYFLYRKYMKTIIKSISFIIILCFMVLGVRNILAVPKSAINEKTGIHDIHKYPNSYDVCFIGRSTVISNISCQELYEQYGIAGVTAGVSGQIFPMSLYTFEEVMNYQSPKVVFLDTRILFESAKSEMKSYQDEAALHFTLDDIKTLSIKRKALEKAKLYNEEIDEWDYYSKLYYSHDNWKNISQKNFLKYDDKLTTNMHGNTLYLDVANNIQNTYATSRREETAVITRQTQKYVSDMLKICEESGSDLVLLTGYVHSTKAQHHAVTELAHRLNLKFLDINQFLIKTNFDYNTDLYDAVHFNLSGAIKMTHLIGDFLTKNYKFSDKRNEDAYSRYENYRVEFDQHKRYLSSKQKLLSSVSFYDYLQTLKNLNTEENIIFITIYGDAMNKLTLKEAQLLQDLELRANLYGKKDGSYAAVIYKDNIQEKFNFLNAVKIEDEIGKLEFEISSGGTKSGERSSILINEKEYFSGGKGFNFFIYNTEFEQILNTCYFDTTSTVNPSQSRNKSLLTINKQEETAPNVWESVE